MYTAAMRSAPDLVRPAPAAPRARRVPPTPIGSSSYVNARGAPAGAPRYDSDGCRARLDGGAVRSGARRGGAVVELLLLAEQRVEHLRAQALAERERDRRAD